MTRRVSARVVPSERVLCRRLDLSEWMPTCRRRIGHSSSFVRLVIYGFERRGPTGSL